MFSHFARYVGGPKDGHKNTIPSLDETPPKVLYVAADMLADGRFERAKYVRQDDGRYAYAGTVQ